MRVPGQHPLAHRLRPLPFETPVVGDVEQAGVHFGRGERGIEFEQGEKTELVGGVFLAAEHRQVVLDDQHVPHLVHQAELGVGQDEARDVGRKAG
ncbi:hypothetical protein D3C80_1599690 [compost metagenome]